MRHCGQVASPRPAYMRPAQLVGKASLIGQRSQDREGQPNGARIGEGQANGIGDWDASKALSDSDAEALDEGGLSL